MSEYNHLYKSYGNNPTMGFTTFNTLTADDKNRIRFMIQNIHPFEAPDMYSKVGCDVYIIEHFEFDASKRTRKGMSGIKEENDLKKRIDGNKTEGCIVDKASYLINKKSFQENFEYIFEQHYKKIDKYIENLKNQKIICDGDNVFVGFFIENIYPPLYEELRNGESCSRKELYYFLTKQFYDFVQTKDLLNFVLFGCTYQGSHQLFYIKPSDRGDNLIDLENDSIVFSKLNGNEITWACSL